MTRQLDPHTDADVASRYVAGTLPPADVRDFELHLLQCARCQRDVREGAAIRAALQVTPASASTRSRPFRSRWARPALGAIAAAAAAMILLVVSRTRTPELGAVSPLPRIATADVRGAGDERARRTDSAVAAYASGDHARARAMFAAVLDSAFEPALAFYAGHAALAEGDPRDAVRLLTQVLADTLADRRAIPYRDDARYLLAKAWLQLRQPDSAFATLLPVTTPAARALSDSIRVTYPR